jgi:AcrR family transcriptional regulator
MSVNKEAKKRIRRTPEEAKALIIGVAADRLGEFGLDGLNISGVAKAAGISHATVIHHFGSTGAMREALLKQMTHDLLKDVMVALDHRESPDKVLDRLFKMLSQDGHGRLLAWLALDQHSFDTAAGSGGLFTNIIDMIEAENGDRQHAKQIVFLVAMAAMGLSICGDAIADLIEMTDEERNNFPSWLAAHLQTI